MKKAGLVLMLVGLLVAGCGGGEIEPQHETDMEKISTSVAATMYAELPKDPTSTPTPSGISVDKGLMNVDITLPASMFSDIDMSTFDTQAYVEENGFNNAVINEDGSITITMSKSKHKEVMEKYTADINSSFNEMISSEDTPYITSIVSDSNFKSVIIEVDRAGYESAFDLTPFTIGLQSMLYQAFAGIDYHCEIIIMDNITKEIITSVIYPDVLQE